MSNTAQQNIDQADGARGLGAIGIRDTDTTMKPASTTAAGAAAAKSRAVATISSAGTSHIDSAHSGVQALAACASSSNPVV